VNFMLVQIDGFVSKVECSQLCQTYDRYATRSQVLDFNGEPLLYRNELRSLEVVSSTIGCAVDRVLKVLEAEFAEILYTETVFLARIGPGGRHPAHADNCKQDSAGNWIPNHTPARVYSAIAYLNCPAEGGEIRFQNQDLTIKPRPGLLVAFPSDNNYLHEVLPVKKGYRYTLPMWFTYREREFVAGFQSRHKLVRTR
jgi:predicted 2-oxoglutarate/Fe(II)-dependent dioxygenase YbiX